MKMRRLYLLFCFMISIVHASDWYVATNGASSGNGSIKNPWDLQTAGTNLSIQAGDNIWLRGGTYVPVGTNNVWNYYLHGFPGFCIAPGPTAYGQSNNLGTNLITFRSYSNEWVAIDRPMIIGSSIRFQDLEFFDSTKGLFRTTNPSIATTNGIIWGEFTHGTNCEWDNCLIHDVCNVWGKATVRDCLVWYAGWTAWEHVFYPSASEASGNIIAFPLNITFNGGDTTLCNSNLIFGENELNLGTNSSADANFTIREQLVGNVFVNPYSQAIGSTFDPGVVCSKNIFTARGTPVNITGASNVLFQHNAYFNTDTHGSGGASGYMQVYDRITENWQVDNNAYFTPTSNLAAGNYLKFVGNNMGYTLSQWRTNFGFDSHSITNYGNPPDSVRVWPNRYQARKCHIAVCNWSLKDNVEADLSGVLTAGDSYRLYNAQNFLAGPIQTGVYDGTAIILPMTNLTTAPILYGGNPNAWGDTFSKPLPVSPTYGAFVVIGLPAAIKAEPLSPPSKLKISSAF